MARKRGAKPRADVQEPDRRRIRAGRAHDAVVQAQRFVQAGRRIVVDVDLEQFFDRVNHDVVMGRRTEGTPQGGPLSPLLANALLDEVDKELEKRGHVVVRYADDCNVYVRSRRTGERVMGLLRRLYTGLRLRINESKSAVASAFDRKLLGYSFWAAAGKTVKRRVAKKAIATMKERVRRLTRRTVGRSVEQVCAGLQSYLLGWKQYFCLADTPRIFADLDEWIRHRLRAIHLKQWKRGATIFRELRARGLSEPKAATVARNGRRWWRNSAKLINLAFPISYFDRLGVPRLAA